MEEPFSFMKEPEDAATKDRSVCWFLCFGVRV